MDLEDRIGISIEDILVMILFLVVGILFLYSFIDFTFSCTLGG